MLGIGRLLAMLRALIRFLRWNIGLWCPILRLLGRLTGQDDRVEQWSRLSEKNIQNSFNTLEGDKE